MILTIFGYPKTGKTLLFNLLTEQKVEISKFSSSAQEYHKSVVDVPDHRLKALADHFETPPVYAKIEYLDTGAISIGEVKNSIFIDLIRRADGLIHIVRAFEDEEIIHPKGSIDPFRDLDDMEEEMKSVDYLSIERRLERLEVDIRKMKSKELVEEFELQKKLKDFLEEGHPLREYPWTEREEYIVRGFKFLSQRPIIKLINTDENSFHEYSKYHGQKGDNSMTLVFCGKIETELLELDPEDRQMFQEEYGLESYEYIKENLIKKSYDLMNLLSFFTVGSDETKAWTINKSSTAFIAAGKIHSDIQQGFIRGEVIEWDKFLEAGSFNKAKELGTLRLEGKEYIVSDGEIIHFRFNK
jgi:GTP-binding protein YchF